MQRTSSPAAPRRPDLMNSAQITSRAIDAVWSTASSVVRVMGTRQAHRIGVIRAITALVMLAAVVVVVVGCDKKKSPAPKPQAAVGSGANTPSPVPTQPGAG